MIEAQSVKNVVAVAPVSLTAAAATGIVIDTQGFNYASYVLSTGAGVVSASVFKIQESDTSGGTYTDVVGAVSTTLPAAADNRLQYGIYMPLGGTRKRYQRVALTATGTAGLYSVGAQLSRANETPDNAAERGLAGQVLIS